MRILMWFGIGFALSCGGCVYFLHQQWILPLTAAAAFAMMLLLLFGIKNRVCRIIAIIFLGLFSGFLRYHSFQKNRVEPAMTMDQQVIAAEMTALDYCYETTYGFRLDARMTVAGKEQNVRVYLDDSVDLRPGDVFTGNFRFRFAAPKEGERTSYLQSNGIFLIADLRGDLQAEGEASNKWRYYPAVIAYKAKKIIERSFPQDVYPLAKAVLLGDTSDLTYEMDHSLRDSGIRHVVAVSGLHVAVIYSFLQTITGKKRFLTALLGLPVLALFAAVAGFTPSVTRACIMTGLMLISQVIQKEYDGPTALSAACLVMLIADPVSVSSVSLQLSAGCVAGIMLFSPRIKAWLDDRLHNTGKGKKNRIKSWCSMSVSVTLGAMSLTTPLSAAYFGAVSIIGVLTNLLTLWILNAVFIGVVLTCVTGAFFLPAAMVLGKLLAWPIRYVLFVADILGSTPFSAVYTSSGWIVAWLIFSYGILALFLIRRKRNPIRLIVAVALGLCLAVGCSWMEPMLYGCVVTVLDVGQGQSIIVQTEGKTILVDCGGDYGELAADAAASKLMSMGIGRLDALILTHGDDDHFLGVEYLMERVDVDLLLLPATESRLDISFTDSEVIWVDRMTALSFGNASVSVYPPLFLKDENENSLCILFDTEKYDILITGDRSDLGERMLLSQYDIPEVGLLVAGHHGSKSSTGTFLLDAVSPETVVISAGRNNLYGHPSQELLDRLSERGCIVRRTDEEGTIVIRR